MLGTTFFVSTVFCKNKNIENNVSKFIFVIINILITTLFCYFIKFIYPINTSISDIYNRHFAPLILTLTLMTLFFITINFEKMNLKLILLFYLLIFGLKYFLVNNFSTIFLSNSIIYFIFILINLFLRKNSLNFIHNVDFSGKTNFLLFFSKKIDLKPYFNFSEFLNLRESGL